MKKHLSKKISVNNKKDVKIYGLQYIEYKITENEKMTHETIIILTLLHKFEKSIFLDVFYRMYI